VAPGIVKGKVPREEDGTMAGAFDDMTARRDLARIDGRLERCGRPRRLTGCA
jgi:hypothetical protein